MISHNCQSLLTLILNSDFSFRWRDVRPYLDQLKGEALVEDAVDLGSARQLLSVHLVPGALDALLKVHAELLHHPATTRTGGTQ